MSFDHDQRLSYALVLTLAHYLPVIGSGVYRTVHQLGEKHVLKVSRYGENAPSLEVDHNIREAKTWLFAPDEVRAHLVPVLDWGPGWVIMPLVLTLWEGGSIPERAVSAMEEALPMWEDKKVSNIGVHEEKFKLLDYADLLEAILND